eukprot:PLAT6448.4.p2 GENE.PLAT6448.4~~PLAT6448.4.p2  ORF type:complete len:264 (-),score=115.80 PLAT6448.4:117-908(-)
MAASNLGLLFPLATIGILLFIVQFTQAHFPPMGPGMYLDVFRVLSRRTGTFTCYLFVSQFAATPLAVLLPKLRPVQFVKDNKRYLVLSMAISQAVHLWAVYRSRSVDEHDVLADHVLVNLLPDTFIMLLGVSGSITMLALALTSNYWAYQRMGAASWSRLYVWGSYFIMALYIIMYADAIFSYWMHHVGLRGGTGLREHGFPWRSLGTLSVLAATFLIRTTVAPRVAGASVEMARTASREKPEDAEEAPLLPTSDPTATGKSA